MYKSDEDKMMSDPKLKWSKSSVIKKEKSKQLEFDFSEPKKTVEKMDGLEKIDHLINRQLLEDQL